MKLLNAFSLNMLGSFPTSVSVREISRHEARVELANSDCESCVGHADTAAVFGTELDMVVECVRSTVTLKPGETVLVGQYRGPRLPEGASMLPEGATIQWLLVTVAM